MVAIGRTLLNDNRVLLVDEPTKGLAPLLVTEVADVLERRRVTPCCSSSRTWPSCARLARDASSSTPDGSSHAGAGRRQLAGHRS